MSISELVSKSIKQCNSFVAKLIGLKQWTTKIQKPITPAILILQRTRVGNVLKIVHDFCNKVAPKLILIALNSA